MFGLDFLFAAGLWALPLAGLPLLLHLLFRQKSPIIAFSTLRFVKLSIQQTAARRRIQKWLLLTCRALLIALLIWAIAQPATKLATGWFTGGRSVAAAIVIDCSYSMQLQDSQLTLLAKADGMVQDLLRNQLAGAKVAVFRNLPAANSPEQLRDASTVLGEWSPLQPQPNPIPLVERVNTAVALLDRQPADQKWLFVLSDFQSREFGRPLPQPRDGRTILFDLHPLQPHSAGVTDVSITPAQPIPGIGSEAVVQITGQPGDSRAVVLKACTLDGKPISESAPAMASLDAGGRATMRFPLKLPPQRWIALTGALTADDSLPWDNQRTRVIEIPPKQSVTILASPGAGSTAERFVKLALDPSEGKLAEWPLTVRSAPALTGRENVAVAILSKWPDAGQSIALRDFARAGHTLVLFLQPGLEDSWTIAAPVTKAAMGDLLPSPPTTRGTASSSRAAVGDERDPLLEGLTDDRFQLGQITIRQLVSMETQGKATAVLNAAPADPISGSHLQGMLFRKAVGGGVCFTFATIPDPRFTSLATHPLFLPLLVRMALPTLAQSSARNVEIGQPLALPASTSGQGEVQLDSPRQEQYRVKLTDTSAGRQYIFTQATEPGVYTWRNITDNSAIAVTNVQLPAAESDLIYRNARDLAAGPDTVVASSVAEMTSKIATINEPQPRWSMPIAIVLLLLCVEALMGSAPKLWKPPSLRAFAPNEART